MLWIFFFYSKTMNCDTCNKSKLMGKRLTIRRLRLNPLWIQNSSQLLLARGNHSHVSIPMSMLKSLHSSQKPIYPGLPLDLYFSVHCTPLIAHSILPFYDIFTTTNLLPVSISDLIQLIEMQEQSTGCEERRVVIWTKSNSDCKTSPAIRHSLKVAARHRNQWEMWQTWKCWNWNPAAEEQSLHTRDNDLWWQMCKAKHSWFSSPLVKLSPSSRTPHHVTTQWSNTGSDYGNILHWSSENISSSHHPPAPPSF